LNIALVEQLSDLRVAQAVHFSARFLYLSPTLDVEMPAEKAARVLMNWDGVSDNKPTRVATIVDGGYFDNSGLGPALRRLEDERATWEHGAVAPDYVILHVLNAQDRTCEQLTANAACRQLATDRLGALEKDDTLGWLTRPLEAIVSVRESHSLLRINEAKTSLAVTQKLTADGTTTKGGAKTAIASPGAAPDSVTGLRSKPECAAINCRFEPIALTFPDSPPTNRPWWCKWLCGEDRTARQVALGWMLAPEERKLMDDQAAIVAEHLRVKYP
jgi:hypothetical protein